MVVAVNERDPGAVMLGVTPVSFIEDPLDHGGGVLRDAGDQPLEKVVGEAGFEPATPWPPAI
jgi:hypothetical protein